MLQPALTYEVMKGVVMNMVQRITNLSTPMDTSNSLEPVDFFGRQPNQANTRPGKGGEGKGKGDHTPKGGKEGKGNGETRVCYNCERPGHIAKDCWAAKKVKGKGRGHDKVGRRDRGSDGKWYRKTGINSFQLLRRPPLLRVRVRVRRGRVDQSRLGCR